MATLFEDKRDDMYPFTLSRDIKNMYYGLFSNEERLKLFFERNKIRDDIRINSSFRGFGALSEVIDIAENEMIIDSAGNEFAFKGTGDIKRSIDKVLCFNHAWEMMSDNPVFITEDIRFITGKEDTYISDNAKIEDCVHINSDNGPVYIDADAIILACSRIEGPCYIGKRSRFVGGKISGSSVFTDSRVGGEVECSIIYPYSNKYHEGFLGHSIIGSFVNLGALTTNSDLKNNYGNITVFMRGKGIRTDLMKLGIMCGDHSKLGIGTLLNSGTVIGFSANLYGGGFFKKEYHSFYWGDNQKGSVYDIEKALETARIVMKRRGIELPYIDEALFRKIYAEVIN